jgi:hypothetical protein
VIWPQTSFVVIAGITNTNRIFDSACVATSPNRSTAAAGCASTEHTFTSIYGASSRCGVDTECATATFGRGTTVHSITAIGTHGVSNVSTHGVSNGSTRTIGKHAPTTTGGARTESTFEAICSAARHSITTSSGHAWTEITPRIACIFVHHGSSSTSTSRV